VKVPYKRHLLYFRVKLHELCTTILPPCHGTAWSESSASRGRRFLAVRAERAAPAVSGTRRAPLCTRRGSYSAWQAHTACYWCKLRNETALDPHSSILNVRVRDRVRPTQPPTLQPGQSAVMLCGWGVKAGMVHFTCG